MTSAWEQEAVAIRNCLSRTTFSASLRASAAIPVDAQATTNTAALKYLLIAFSICWDRRCLRWWEMKKNCANYAPEVNIPKYMLSDVSPRFEAVQGHPVCASCGALPRKL